jgi:hypothetical protein
MSRQLQAEAETAWAMALASDEAIRAMCTVAPQEVVRMAWIMGHFKGRLDGVIAAENIYAEAMISKDKAERFEGRPEHDRDTRGNPL